MSAGKVKRLASSAARLLVKAGLLPNAVILKMDGGLCSQMHFFLIGSILRDRGEKVLYNLDWFEKDGKDTDGRFSRNFELTKVFPDLDFSTSPRWLNRLFKSLLYHYREDAKLLQDTGWVNLRAPLYMSGYFDDVEEMYGDRFRRTFQFNRSVLDETNIRMLTQIEKAESEGKACAVHVRRGDLARYSEAYGNPVTPQYYVSAFSRMAGLHSDVRFFIFSDEPGWCREHLSAMLKGHDVTICDINGSDKAYGDLLLMSRCSLHITSQGSMGRYAAMMRDEQMEQGLVILPANSELKSWQPRFANCETIK